MIKNLLGILTIVGDLISTIILWWFAYATTITFLTTIILLIYFAMKQRRSSLGMKRSPVHKKRVPAISQEDGELTKERKASAARIKLLFSLFTFGSGYLLYILLRSLFYELAKKDQFFTLRAEGEYKPKMRGDVCVGYIAKVENHRIDPDDFDVFKGTLESLAAHLVKVRGKKLIKDPSFVERKLKLDPFGNPVKMGNYYQLTDDFRRRIEEANSTTVFEELFGVVPIGFKPYRIFEYPYRWIEYTQERPDGAQSTKVDMRTRKENLRSIFHRYPKYGIVIEQAETGAGSRGQYTNVGSPILKIQIRVKAVFETETVNPHKSLFRTGALSSAGSWQQAIAKEITAKLISWIKSSDWDEINKKSEAEGALLSICNEINGVDEDGFRLTDTQVSSVLDYGQKIIKISLVEVDLEDKELQKAVEDVFVAERGAEKALAEARGIEAKAAAPLIGKARGLEAIARVPMGPEIQIAESLGNIQVYAPGGTGNNLLYTLGVLGNNPKKGGKKKTEEEESDGSST